jgi:hypothetical protein
MNIDHGDNSRRWPAIETGCTPSSGGGGVTTGDGVTAGGDTAGDAVAGGGAEAPSELGCAETGRMSESNISAAAMLHAI